MESNKTDEKPKFRGYEKLWKSGSLPATGIVALESRMITKEQFDTALKCWESEKETNPEISFEYVLVKKEMISSEKMMRLIPATIRKMNVEFGDIAVNRKLISRSYIDKALKVQAEKFKAGELVLLSDLLIKAGLLSEKQRDKVYKIQNMKTLDWMISYDGSKRYDEKRKKIREAEEFQLEITSGELAVAYQFINREELESGLNLLEKVYDKGLKSSLEKILEEKGLIDEEKAHLLKSTKSFLATRDLDIRFLLAAVQEEHFDKIVAKKILEKQSGRFKKDHKSISATELVIEEQLMTREQCNVILTKQGRTVSGSGEADAVAAKLLEKDYDIDDYDAHPDSEGESEIIVNIGSDFLIVEIIIPPSYPSHVSKEDIKNMLMERNIITGIVEDHIIDEHLAEALTGIRRFTVAKGRSPIPGTDAQLILHFQRDYLNPGKVTEDGTIDFRDRGAVPYVLKGDILAEIIRETYGTPGEDVYGEDVPAPPVNEVIVTVGKGTEFSENRLKVYALEDGQPGMTVAGEISVLPSFKVDEDVDFNTGNIIFNGHITVKGSVREGFSVIGGSLTAGAIDGGKVDLKGNLEVSAGIVNATIRTEGNIQAMYVADSKIESYGDVIIKKEIIDSEVNTSGGCNSEGATLVASSITAMQGVQVAQIGTEVSEKCHLRVGVNFHTVNEIKKHRAQIEKVKAALVEKQADIEKNEKKHDEINEMVASNAQAQEIAKEQLNVVVQLLEFKEGRMDENTGRLLLSNEIKHLENVIRESDEAISRYFSTQENLKQMTEKVREACGVLVEKIEKLNLGIREIKQWSKNQKRDAVVKVSKTIHQGTVVTGPNTSIALKELCRHSSIREVAGDITQGEYSWVMKIIPD